MFVYGPGHKRKGKRCHRNAVGSSTLCKRHGGNPVIRDNLLPSKYKEDLRVKYDPSIHLLGVIAFSNEGMSEKEIAGAFGVSANTLRSWEESYDPLQPSRQAG